MELRDKEEPTSEKEGYTGDTYCLDCNTLLTKGDKIPKVSQTTTEDKKTEDSSLAAEDKKITDSQQVTKLPSAGTKLEDEKSGAVYEVTMANQAERTVTYLKPVDAEEKNITVPATMTMDGVTYKVTVVAENAFKNNKKIEKVTIEKNVTDIEEKAFYGCSNLKNVSLGSDVNVIGESAFSGCKNLNKVSLNKNLIVIDDKAFYRCTKLSGVTIPSKVKTIGEDAFYGCKNLKKITIKTTKLTNKNVGKKAFKGISSKAVIKVPKNKAAAYKKLLQSKGISPKVKIKK